MSRAASLSVRVLAVAFLLSAVVLPAAVRTAIPLVGGDFRGKPGGLAALSGRARALVDRAFADVVPEGLVDHHVHVVGTGAGGTGCAVHPDMLTWLRPAERFRFRVFAAASGVRDLEHADAAYVRRLAALAEGFRAPLRLHLLAFDRFHHPDGSPDESRTHFFVPNDCVLRLAAESPERFVPVVSVHPYRRDAVAELRRCRARGARTVKWLPNAMGMDPADPRCDPFYDALLELDMALLCHTGREGSVPAAGLQHLGSPLRLRRPLDRGVTVIMAHCASDGTDVDWETAGHPEVPSLDLCFRLLGEERYRGRALADISATTLVNRLPDRLRAVLDRPDLFDRMVHGSDYPVPGIGAALRTGALARHGFLTEEEAGALDEIYPLNPLLFDYVVKRTIRHPEKGRRFPAALFGPRAPLSSGRPVRER